MDAVRSSYARYVVYYEKPLSHDEVVAEMNRFVERWPVRTYRIKPRSTAIYCTEKDRLCVVTGTLTFDARSAARRQRSVGEANFEFGLSFDTDSPRILKENGKTVRRRIEPYIP